MVLANYNKVKLKLCMTCAHVHMLEDWHASEMNPPEKSDLDCQMCKTRQEQVSTCKSMGAWQDPAAYG